MPVQCFSSESSLFREMFVIQFLICPLFVRTFLHIQFLIFFYSASNTVPLLSVQCFTSSSSSGSGVLLRQCSLDRFSYSTSSVTCSVFDTVPHLSLQCFSNGSSSICAVLLIQFCVVLPVIQCDVDSVLHPREQVLHAELCVGMPLICEWSAIPYVQSP